MANRIGVIGCGNMGRALLAGLLAAGTHKTSDLIAADPAATQRDLLHAQLGVDVSADNGAILRSADVIVLAVKPQSIPTVLNELQPHFSARHLLISIAAGVSTATLESQLPEAVRVVRAMPNLPAVVQAGATALCAGTRASAQDLQVAKAIFDSVGRTAVVAESLMNAVTGLSGSGPAYAMVVIEGLADGGVQMGLPRDVATVLAAQTVYGAAKLLLDTHEHPGQLKDRVASPAGTTIAGIHALEQAGVRHAMMTAVQAATERAHELGALAPTRR